MRRVGVNSDDRLHIFSESLYHKGLGYFESEFGRDVLRIRKAHYVVDRFDMGVAFLRLGAVKAVTAVLLIDGFHLQIGFIGIGGAVERGRVMQLLGLIGVQNIAQIILYGAVNTDMLDIRRKRSTSSRSFSTSEA